jgi:pimeloyl-ACP methyl ester carboxylesterase
MNRLPQLRTEIDGLPIHFVHVRGRGPNPAPILLSHGWPWTFRDFRKLVGPLTDPAAHGGDSGAFISTQLGHKHADRIIGVNLTTPGKLTFMTGGGWDEADYAPVEAALVARMQQVRASEMGHFVVQSTKPQNLAVAFGDSPAGLLAWLVDKQRS